MRRHGRPTPRADMVGRKEAPSLSRRVQENDWGEGGDSRRGRKPYLRLEAKLPPSPSERKVHHPEGDQE